MDSEHRSRRDMSPQGRKRAALMITRDQPVSIAGYQTYRKVSFQQVHFFFHNLTLSRSPKSSKLAKVFNRISFFVCFFLYLIIRMNHLGV